MKPSNRSIAETLRIGRLGLIKMLDSEPEERFDRLTRLARRLLKVPTVLVVISDGRGFRVKSCDGMALEDVIVDSPLCRAIGENRALFFAAGSELPGTPESDPLLALMPGVSSIAAVPLLAGTGGAAGLLIAMDAQPRTLDADDCVLFTEVARLVEHELITTDQVATDPLTCLANRRGFESMACKALRAARREGRNVGMMYFDLDGLSSINERFGRSVGNSVLCTFGQILSSLVRSGDVVGRVGGDEFALMLMNADRGDCELVSKRIQIKISNFRFINRLPYDIQYSQGICSAHAGADQVTLDSLLQRADAEMFRHKRVSGRQPPARIALPIHGERLAAV